ncbi:MAG: helix-turn-helix transcriptional regulator [Leptolyngbyaceae cyanobacterium T60_A2020_046]|nr:helix-turn-helix transcriptional regulator [Leptolyngbyaceae cyanobacterium T60_A2020_046]
MKASAGRRLGEGGVIRWKLHDVMSKKRIRNKDLAEALGITENSVYRLRRADEMPRLTPQRLEGICAALNCQPGDLLEWHGTAVPGGMPPAGRGADWEMEEASIAPSASVLIERSTGDDYRAMQKVVFQRLAEFHPQILALSWQGYRQYGPGAVVFSDFQAGAQIAYVEIENLSDPACRQAVQRNRPERSAVVLYYQGDNYAANDYEILVLTGALTPPDYARQRENPDGMA